MAGTSVSEQGAQGFVRELGLFDAVMIVTGSMIGSGIFLVSANVARQLGAAGWVIAAWTASGLLVVAAALCFGELAAMMPRVGGQYVYLRETYSPLLGFLYGWTLCLVIQTGTIAAVAVAFARFLGVLAPGVSSDYLLGPVDLSAGYAVSLSRQQLVAILLIVLLSAVNALGLRVGKLIQNSFTAVKTLALGALIVVGLLAGWNREAVSGNFAAPFTARGAATITPDLLPAPPVSAEQGGMALLVVFLIALVGPLFSASAWNDVTFAAGEIREPQRNLPRALAAGVGLVSLLYVLANVAYTVTLPVAAIQTAPEDRVATVALQAILGPPGAAIMALAIVISTFGCNNGLILAGARVYYAMAKDGLFFRAAGRLNRRRVPAVGLAIQCLWASLLVVLRTRKMGADGAVTYGNVYSNLLEYVVFAVLLFHIVTLAGLFVLRRRRPDAERPYRVWGYPWTPLFYVVGASLVVAALLVYRTQTTWPGLLIVLAGIPVFLLWRRSGAPRLE